MTVKLKTKKLQDGRISFFLQYYNPVDKCRKKEYLSLYLFFKPKDELERLHNKETKQLAENVHAKKQLELQSQKFGFKPKSRIDPPFLVFVETLCEKRKSSKINFDTWRNTLIHLKRFTRERIKQDIRLSQIDSEYLENFKEYLLREPIKRSGTRLSQNSCYSYFNIVRSALNEAFDNHDIVTNPCRQVKSIKQADANREFLTEEEITRLFNTECQIPRIKNAFLFGVLTGMRFCDIQGLEWKDIQHSEINGAFVRFQQKKTKAFETLFISEQALSLLGPRQESNQRIFVGLKYSAHNNHLLSRWMHDAQINKHITFHCSRHTHAVLLLARGVDIYTVSKLLGHRNLKTTQIYAKVIDSNKVSAIKKIPIF